MNRPRTSELVEFLKRQQIDSNFKNRLKVAYRPYITPFDDLLKIIKDGDSVFDIGCGSGQFAILLAEFTKVSKIGGVEISAELIKNANHLMAPYAEKVPYEFHVYDGKQIPEGINRFNVIVLIDVLHHIPADLHINFLSEIFKKMSLGSLLIIKDIEASSSLVYFNKLHDLVFSGEIGNERSSYWTIEKLRDIGFQIESVKRKNLYVYPHYTILARKQ